MMEKKIQRKKLIIKKGDKMKFEELKKYMWVFVLAVLIIAVYKTFDSIGVIFGVIVSILSVFSPVVVAFCIAFLLFPMCRWMETVYQKVKIPFVKKYRRGLGVLSVFAILIFIIALIMWLLIPRLAVNIKEFVLNIPYLARRAIEYVNGFGFVNIDAKEFIENFSITKWINNFDFSNVNKYVESVAGASGTVIDLVLSVIISIYILIDRDALLTNAKRVLRLLIKENHRKVMSRYLKMACNFVYKYVYCQLIDATVVFILAFVILMILDVKYALVLAFILGILNLVPYFGAFIAITSAVLITIATSSFAKGLIVLASLVVLQQVDANLIQPRLVRHVLSVKPFWVLCGVLVGGDLFGILGIILAVPVMAFFKAIITEYLEYTERKQGINTHTE